jgi:hypothetical protein
VTAVEPLSVNQYEGYRPVHNYPKTKGLLPLTPASTLVFRRSGGGAAAEEEEEGVALQAGKGGDRWERKLLAADKRSKKTRLKRLRERENAEWATAGGRDSVKDEGGDVGAAMSAVAYLLGS